MGFNIYKNYLFFYNNIFINNKIIIYKKSTKIVKNFYYF